MTDTLRILVYAPGEFVDVGPEESPTRGRVLSVTVQPGGTLRYRLGWWHGGEWFELWFPGWEVRPVD